MSKISVILLVLYLIFQSFAQQQCDNLPTCEACSASNGCSWCSTGTCATIAAGCGAGQAIATCTPNYTTCVDAPTIDKCALTVGTKIFRSNAANCATSNAAMNVTATDLCLKAIHIDGIQCQQAILNYRCSMDCEACNDPTTLNSTIIYPCQSVCTSVRLFCPQTFNSQGCLDFLQCSNDANCANLLQHVSIAAGSNVSSNFTSPVTSNLTTSNLTISNALSSTATTPNSTSDITSSINQGSVISTDKITLPTEGTSKITIGENPSQSNDAIGVIPSLFLIMASMLCFVIIK